jgi:tRNA threonylcarbamoyladenosine biosynthesis protein TsaB
MTVRVLALDTTSEYGSIAVLNGNEVREVLLHSTEGFAQIIFGHLEATLGRCHLAISDIHCFAAASGPGAFTGVRVGLAAIKGLAASLRRPVVAVSNLKAIASFGTRLLRAPVIDARRGEVYAAVYDSDLKLVMPEVVAPLTVWRSSLPSTELEFLSPDMSASHFELSSFTTTPRALAGAIARIARTQYDAGEALDAAAVDANYVRRSDAELFWKE